MDDGVLNWNLAPSEAANDRPKSPAHEDRAAEPPEFDLVPAFVNRANLVPMLPRHRSTVADYTTVGF